MNRQFLGKASLAALALGLISAAAAQTFERHLYVESRDPHAAERLARSVGSSGKVAARSGDSTYRIVVPADRSAAAEAALKAAGFSIAKSEAAVSGQPAYNSRESIALRLKEAKAQKPNSLGKRPGVSYLEALQHFTHQRAYPFQEIDYGAIRRAAEIRDMLPDYRPSGSRERSLPPTWQFVGPTNLDIPYQTYFGQPPLGGRTNAIAVDPGDPSGSTIYIGSASGGVWKTTNGGVNWSPLSNSWSTQPVNCLLINDGILYAGLGDLHGNIGYGAGIKRSTDGGATWTTIGLPTLGATVGVTKIVATGPTNNVLVATTGGAPGYWGGIYRSTDAGTSWTRVDGTFNTIFTGLTVGSPDGTGNKILYAAAAGYAAARIYKSTDDGATWSGISIPGITTGDFKWSYDVAASKLNSQTVYFLAPASGERKVLRSTDAGATWTEIQAGMDTGGGYNWSQYYYNYYIQTAVETNAGGSEDMVFTGNIDVSLWRASTGWVSIGGPTWNGASSVLHNDQHSFAVNPNDPNVWYMGNDGGIFRLNRNGGGFTVTPLNRTYGTHLVYHLDVHPTLDNTMLAGMQDNATGYAQGDLSNWLNVGGGDGAYSSISRTNPSHQFTSAQSLQAFKTTDSWATASFIYPGFPGQRPGFIAPMELNQGNQDFLIAGTNYLWQYQDSTNTWTQLGTTEIATPSGSISAIETTPDPQRIYAGSDSGDLFMTKDGGATYTSIVGSLPNRAITDIDALDSDPRSVIVTVSGTGTPHVYQCTNVDAASPVWLSISGPNTNSLPDVPTNAIVRDPSAPATKFWLGTDLGVFVTENGGSLWMDATTSMGLPIVIVNMLAIDTRTNLLYAGTYGRGIYRLQINQPALAALTITPNTAPVGYATNLVGKVTMNTTSASTRIVSLTATGVPAGATYPSTVIIPANALERTFLINVAGTTATGNPVFSATYDGVTKTANLAIVAPTVSSVTFNPAAVIGGNGAIATAVLNAPAMSSGQSITLSSSNTALATTTASIYFAPGTTSKTFAVQTYRTAVDTPVTITVGSKTANVTVQQANLTLVSTTTPEICPSNPGGRMGKVNLNRNAPTGGTVISLSSNNPAVLAVPASVTVPANGIMGNFTLTPGAVTVPTNVVITGTHVIGATTITRGMTVKVVPTYLTAFSITPSAVRSGGTATGKVTISAPAPVGGSVVALSSANPAAAPVPATVTVPAGATFATFPILTPSGVTGDPSVVVTASHGGASKSAGLRVTENAVTSVLITPSPATSGATMTVTVNLAAPAASGGITLTGTTMNAAAFPMPASIVVPEGLSTYSFTVTAGTVAAPTTVSTSITYKGVGAGANARINP